MGRRRYGWDVAVPAGLFAALLWGGCSESVAPTDGGPPDAARPEPPAPLDDPTLSTQYRLDPHHQGLAPPGARLEGPLGLRWKSKALGLGAYTASKSSPAVDGDAVYVGMDSGILYALERDTGQVRWQFRTRRADIEDGWEPSDDPLNQPLGIHGSPALDSAHVYIGDYSGYLYAVDRADGTLVWEQKLGGSIGASPTLHEGLLFVSVEYPDPDARVFLVEAATGTPVVGTPFFGQHSHSSVSLDPDRGLMFVGDNSGAFRAFDYLTPERLWSHSTTGPIKSTAAVHEGTVWITSWDFALHALDVETGEVRYRYASGAESMSSPSVYGGRVHFGSHDRALHTLDAETGEGLWVQQLDGTISSSPTIVPDSDLLVVGSGDGAVHLLNLETGVRIQRIELDAAVSSVPVVLDGQLYVHDNSGTLWRFDSPR